MATDVSGLHEKIRGLLRKAEGTPYEEEAAVFYEKAQELIAKYAIDQEALWATDASLREEIHTEDITIKDKMAGAHYRRTILQRIANNNNCRVWYTSGTDTTTVCGYPSDTLFVVMLYNSVMTHMNFRMADALARHTAEGRTTRTFRKSFTVGYSDRICERLNEMRRAQLAVLRTQVDTSGKTTDLVLRDRATKVNEWVDENMQLTARKFRDSGKSDHTAMGAGYLAGNTADLTGGKGGSIKRGNKALDQ